MTRACAAVILLALTCGVSYARTFSVRPSVFETHGSYTDRRTSEEHAGYVTVAIHDRHYLTAGYSDLTVSHPDWSYHQKMPVGGVLLSHWPWRMKAYAGYMAGTFSSARFSGYADHATVGSVEAMFSRPLYELGLSYARFSGKGQSYAVLPPGQSSKLTSEQITGRLTCVLASRWSATVRPNFTHVEDGRTLYSLAAKAVYVPRRRWTFQAGGFIGERAYYFDNDLLVIFNQNDTQRGMIFGEAETQVWKSFSVTAEYIYTHFDYSPVAGLPGGTYSIRYLVAGIKSRIPW
ncbi:MAG TPA: hypothetical protein VGL38_13515 [bacterium]|jgi:hypothetical protein